MSNKNLIFQVEKNKTQIVKTLLTNVIKMMVARRKLKKEKQESLIKEITENIGSLLEFKIKLDDDKILKLKIVRDDISSMSNYPDISNFVKSPADYNILIGITIKKQIIKKINSLSNNKFEMFEEYMLMQNLEDYVLFSKHVLLDQKEKQEVISKYNASLNQLTKIKFADPANKYYGGKVGDVYRIIRSSHISGGCVAYRAVVDDFL